MWDKLLALFKDKPVTNEIQSVIPDVQPVQQESQPDNRPEGRSVHIGYNYLKGLNDEDDLDQPHKFITLNKLLRGDYKDGKVEATHAEQETNLRRKNS
jgi:hypothetical protein